VKAVERDDRGEREPLVAVRERVVAGDGVLQRRGLGVQVGVGVLAERGRMRAGRSLAEPRQRLGAAGQFLVEDMVEQFGAAVVLHVLADRLPGNSTTAASSAFGSRPLGRMLEADDDIAVFLPGLHVPVGHDDLVKRIRPVYDRLELP
jgi:hypothetical protein